jgi:toxin FitB
VILDTNVLSEMARPLPDQNVVRWLSHQPSTRLCTTTICVAEINAGIALLPPGLRRDQVEARMARGLLGLAARTYGFDLAAAMQYGKIFAKRQALGRPLRSFDGLIAAIARARGLVVVSRNSADFNDCGVEVINPWLTLP